MSEDKFENSIDFEEEKAEETVSDIEEPEAPSFAEELENYLPTPENTDKVKKPLPQWLISSFAAAVTSLVILVIFTLLIFPHIKPSAVISYVDGSLDTEKTEELTAIGTVAEKAAPSIVSVSGTNSYRGFFGFSSQNFSGSGIVISENGYVLTNFSLVGANGDITVKVGKDSYTAKLVGQDPAKDIAILKIEAEGLKFATLENSESVRTGDNVIAMANILGGDIGVSVTRGIVCGVNSGVTLSNGSNINLIQTDAMAGVSGGCLLNENGNVIGMLTSSISTNSDKIGLAIPSADILTTADSIINTGLAPSGLILGIRGADAEHGVTVEAVNDDTPAKKAGIKVGDLILKADGTLVKTVAEINKIRDTHKKGDTMVITVYRDGEVIDINVVL